MIYALEQDITRWAPSTDGYGGMTFTTPVALKGRWEKKEVEFRDPKGDTVVSKSIVYFDVALPIGDYIFLGASVALDPTALNDAYPVKQIEEIPDLNNLETLYKVYL